VEFFHPCIDGGKIPPCRWRYWTTFIGGIFHHIRLQCTLRHNNVCSKAEVYSLIISKNSPASLRNLVCTSFFISFTSPPIFVSITTLIIHHSFTLSLQAQNLPFQQILPTLTFLLYSLDCLHDHGTGPDVSCLSVICCCFFLLLCLFSLW